jgi:hypothetical protein
VDNRVTEDEQQVQRQGRQAIPFLPIVHSVHRKDIDEKLFEMNTPVKRVHEWLRDDKNVDDISYIMLYRYYTRHKQTAIEAVVEKNAQEAQQSNWDLMTDVVSRYHQYLKAGGIPKGAEAMQAIKMMSDMIDRYGGIPGTKQVIQDARRRFTILVDIVLDVVTPEQRDVIYERIQSTPDLMEWTTMEDDDAS